jgi:valyl-tRNA synthetase
MELPKAYNPAEVEEKWYAYWEKNGFFHATVRSDKKSYTIVIPPPNITGILTMGHVLNNTIQDVFIRWRRMQGYEALWMPGTDHAGIATQNAVERALAKEGKSRHDFGREKFIERVWEWKNEYGDTIIKQLKKLGASCDWERLRFTMDDGLSEAVRETFVRMFDKGLIYRGKYIVNWCPFHRTALSDDEVDYAETNGHLWHIRYKVEGSNDYAVVATTRPETMLGDTAIAVNPKDERYHDLIGRTAILPIVGRRIPIIGDEYVDSSFGTGMVKVTPAHDPNDFLMGQRHNLEKINIFTEDAKLNESVPKDYEGLDRFECRKKIVKNLEELGYLVKTQPHSHNVGTCYRCHTVVEPYLSDQWFVRMKPLAKMALHLVQSGKIRFHPDRWTKVYEHWMNNIRDWCISRQIWWGHRIPVYYADDGNYTAARSEAGARTKLGIGEDAPIRQDEDVLDTWFSSWLWPFSTLGWPNDTPELRYFNPTDTLVTAPDIIFFWVARMVMANAEFMKGMPGKTGKARTSDDELVPFRDVYFTSVVRDTQGRKMSKSLGNSPDPLDVIGEYGADALRFTIVYLAPLGQDVLFSAEKCELGRNFANKLWNAGRFLLLNKEQLAIQSIPQSSHFELHVDLADRWILSRLHSTIGELNAALENFDINQGTKILYDFAWHDFCDWYVELIKTRLYGDEPTETKGIVLDRALNIFDQLLRLAHPFMPFVTEELWQRIAKRGPHSSIMISHFPITDKAQINKETESEMAFVQRVIESVRNIRGEMGIAPSKEIGLKVRFHNKQRASATTKYASYLSRLAKVTSVEHINGDQPRASASAVVDGEEIFVPLEGLIDLSVERERLQKEITRLESAVDGAQKKLSNEQFRSRAPKEVVEKEREKLEHFSSTLEKLRRSLQLLT